MLTIYIPTFNRKECLSRLLNLLFNEIDSIDGCSHIIKIHVSDNCSNDGTHELLQSFERPYFKFSTLKENIGGDGNIRNSLNLCTTKFLWVLGDDDFPMPGVISFIINTLRLSDPKLLYLPARWSRNPQTILPHRNLLNRIAIQLDSVRFIKRVNVKITFISSFIFNFYELKKSKNSELLSLVAGTNFEQIGMFMPLVIEERYLFVCNSNCIVATGNDSFKYSLIKAFGVDLPIILTQILYSRQDLLKIMLNKLILGYMPGFISKVQNGKDLQQRSIPWSGIHQQLSTKFLYWIVILPMRYMPGFISRVWALIFRWAR